MRLVLANHGFASAGGSETYLLTLAEHLQRLGHEVVVYAHELGPFTDHARRCGVEVRGELRELPSRSDVIFSQDAIVAYELAERFPGAKHVFRACSDVYDFELPPQLDDVVDVVVVLSDRYARLVRGCGVRAPVLRLRAPVDLDRLSPRGRIRPRARRAVLLGNYDDRHGLVEEVWGERGIDLVKIGEPKQRYDVAAAVAEADIVVAKSRAALDGMACGKAVYIYDMLGGDGWVTPAIYPSLEADHFAGQATERVIGADDLARDLDEYDPHMGITNRDVVVQHHGARDHALGLLAGIDGEPAKARPIAPMRELARLTALQWSWERNTRGLQAALTSLDDRLRSAEGRSGTAEAARATAEAQRATAEAQVGEREAEVEAVRDDLGAAQERLGATQTRLDEVQIERDAARAQLDAMRGTRAWRMATRYRRLRRRLGSPQARRSRRT